MTHGIVANGVQIRISLNKNKTNRSCRIQRGSGDGHKKKIMKNLSLSLEHIETLKKCLEKQMENIDRKIDAQNNIIQQTIYCEQKPNLYRKTILLRDKLQNKFNQLESVWIKLH